MIITTQKFRDLIDVPFAKRPFRYLDCYGSSAEFADCCNDVYRILLVHDTVLETIYSVVVLNYITAKAWRWINPEYRQAFYLECAEKGLSPTKGWKDVKFCELQHISSVYSAARAAVEYYREMHVPYQKSFNFDPLLTASMVEDNLLIISNGTLTQCYTVDPNTLTLTPELQHGF